MTGIPTLNLYVSFNDPSVCLLFFPGHETIGGLRLQFGDPTHYSYSCLPRTDLPPHRSVETGATVVDMSILPRVPSVSYPVGFVFSRDGRASPSLNLGPRPVVSVALSLNLRARRVRERWRGSRPTGLPTVGPGRVEGAECKTVPGRGFRR